MHEQVIEQAPKQTPMVQATRPTGAKSRLRAQLGRLRRRLVPGRLLEPLANRARHAIVRSPMLSSIYYALFNRAFAREHQAMLAGRLRYERNLETPSSSSPLLRRNIHRLEKGLLMRPRRPVFAVDYLEETVRAYKAALDVVDTAGCGHEEVQWARGVLTSYFEAAGPNPTVDRCRELFHRLPHPRPGEAQCVPYARDLREPPAVSYQALFDLAVRRRSVRWFIPKSVPRELVDQAVLVAGLSPSACNRQPFVFRIVDDRDLLAKVAAIPMGTEGYRQNIPMLVVVVGQLRNFFSERDRHLIYIDASLAAMSFAFAIESLGLSSCMINWPDIEEKERQIANVLHLDVDERPIMLIAVGYPDHDGLVAASIKKSVRQLRIYNMEGGTS